MCASDRSIAVRMPVKCSTGLPIKVSHPPSLSRNNRLPAPLRTAFLKGKHSTMITRRQFVLGAAALPLSGQLLPLKALLPERNIWSSRLRLPPVGTRLKLCSFSPIPAHTACSLNRISRSGPKQPLLMLPSASALLLGSPSLILSLRPTSLSKPLALLISFPCRF